MPLIADGIILEINRKNIISPIKFMGIKDYISITNQMPLGESTGIDLPGEVWNNFHKIKKEIPKIPRGREIGVSYIGDAPEGSFTYFAGTEVLGDAEKENFYIWELPAREYIICGFEAEDFKELVTIAINKAVKFIRLWLKNHEMTVEFYSPEIYYDSSPESNYMELWIPFVKIQQPDN